MQSPSADGPPRTRLLTRVRNLCALIRAAIGARQGLDHSQTTAALGVLEAAVVHEFGSEGSRQRKRTSAGEPAVRPGRPTATIGQRRTRNSLRRPVTKNSVRSLQAIVRRRDKKITELKEKLAKQEAKQGGWITTEWLVRCSLAAPTVSVRSLVRSFKDAEGVDQTVVGRSSLCEIRGAFVETLKDEVGKCCSRAVVSARTEPRCRAAGFLGVVLLHVQDAADLRLRSKSLGMPALPRRGRASNVLANVLEFYVGECTIAVPSELVPLARKNANTLATALDLELRRVCAGAGLAGDGPWAWLLHVILQDGVATNMAACSLLLAVVRAAPLGPRTLYFLVAMTCAAHSSNLVSGSVVRGLVADLGDVKGFKLQATLCGTAVRLYKYLLSDYWEQFLEATREWVESTLQCLPWERRDTDHEERMLRLQALYTTHVISDECCQLFNGGLQPLRHVVGSGCDPLAERPVVVRRVVSFIVKSLYVVDEKPVVTRMFTFRDGINHALTMHLLGIPAHCFKTGKVTAQQTSQKRLDYVFRFFNHADAGQLLRRTCLALQISGGVTALVSHKDTGHFSERATSGGVVTAGASAAVGRPLLCRLVDGAAQQLAADRRVHLWRRMHVDDGLNVVGAVTMVLCAELETVLRFRSYRQMPFALCR